MICPNCGNTITTQKICPKCGCEIVVDRINPENFNSDTKIFSKLKNIFIIMTLLSTLACIFLFIKLSSTNIISVFCAVLSIILALISVFCFVMQKHFEKAYAIYTEKYENNNSDNADNIAYSKSFKDFIKLNYKKF